MRTFCPRLQGRAGRFHSFTFKGTLLLQLTGGGRKKGAQSLSFLCIAVFWLGWVWLSLT